MTLGDALGLAALVATIIGLGVGGWALRYGAKQLDAAVSSIEASVATEVRALSRATSALRKEITDTFPLHDDFVARYPQDTWEVWVDEVQLPAAEQTAVISHLHESESPSVATWSTLGELSEEQFSSARQAVGFFNDLCQMLDDGTPGHFIFQQYHQQILSQGTLVLPVVYRRQASGRWGVRAPSLVNRAAIYHDARELHNNTTVKVRRALTHLPPELLGGRGAARVELLIPVCTASDFEAYPDVEGRSVQVDYESFRSYFTNWSPPRSLH